MYILTFDKYTVEEFNYCTINLECREVLRKKPDVCINTWNDFPIKILYFVLLVDETETQYLA